MKNLFLTVLFFAMIFSCGGPKITQEGLYPVVFEPNPATISGGVCSSTVNITGDPDWNETLLMTYVTLTDVLNANNTVSYTDSDVSSLFGAIYLPRAGYLEGSFSVDGVSRGLTGEFDVAFLLFTSATNGYPRNYLGILQCRN